MRMVESLKKFNLSVPLLLSLALASTLSLADPAYSQAPPPNGIATIMLPVQQSPNGQQVATTPRGLQFPLPGAGVNGNAVQVFTGPQGGYWYVDRSGANITLLSPGQQLPQLPYYGQTNAYAPPPSQPTTQNVEVNTAPSSSGSSGSGAAGAMMAGAAGMMAGTAMGYAMGDNNNYYNGMPYGHPVYYGGGGKPYYYGAGGKPVYVNNKNVDVNAVNNQQQWYQKTIQNDPQTAQHWQNSRNQQMQQSPGQFSQMQQNPGQFNQQAQQAEQGGRRGRRGQGGQQGQGQFQANQGGQLGNREAAGGRGGFEGRGGGRAGGFGGRRGR